LRVVIAGQPGEDAPKRTHVLLGAHDGRTAKLLWDHSADLTRTQPEIRAREP
jgi:hypothetical protein